MEVADGAQLRITARDGSGEATFRVRVVTTGDGRLGCCVPDRLAWLVEQDPSVRVADVAATARVVRSGRLHGEVHGRLRAARRLPVRRREGPVLLVER